ncbi:TonB-dependent receptor [Myxococcaceae bacterium GXIMD 01537]
MAVALLSLSAQEAEGTGAPPSIAAPASAEPSPPLSNERAGAPSPTTETPATTGAGPSIAAPASAEPSPTSSDERAESPPPTDAPARPEPTPLGNTTVRAPRPAASAAEVTLSRDVLDAAPRSNAVDLLRLVPGLVVSQHSGEGKAQQLFLRGFDALHGQDVELNVGGLPVNEVSHIHALGYADANFVIPEVVRELRVTEGSYRAAQGDYAVAGTVRMELGLEEPGILVSGTLGQFGQRRLVAAVRPGDDPETFAAVELGEGEGFGPQRGFGRASLLAQAALELGTGPNAVRVRALAGSYASRFDSPGVVREDDYATGQRDFFDAAVGRQGGSAVRHQLLLGLELPRQGGSRTVVELFGILADLRLRNNFTGFRVDERGDGLEQTNDGTTLGVRAEHRRQARLWGRPVSLELGLGARRDGVEQTQRRYRQTDGTFFSDEVDASFVQTDVWAYAEAHVPLGRWKLLLGGRADALGVEVFDALAFRDPRFYDGQGYARSAFGAHLGAKAGLEYGLTDAWRLFASYGDGFRSPQARSLGEGERAPFVSVRGAELGARHEGARLAAQVSLFGSQVDDDFYFDHTVGTTVFTGETLRGGVAASVQARPAEGLTVALSGTWAHAWVTKSDTLLPYFAPLVARADVGWERPVTVAGTAARLHAGTGLTLLGPRPLPFDEFSRTVFLADAQVGARWEGVGVRLDVKNVLDARWRDGEFVYSSRFDPGAPASLIPARHFTAGSPRMASLTLEVHL